MSLDSMDIAVADVDEFWYGKPHLAQSSTSSACTHTLTPLLLMGQCDTCLVVRYRVGRDPHPSRGFIAGHPGQHSSDGDLPLLELAWSVLSPPCS